MVKLSVRAWEILLAIDERCWGEPGGGYWTPSEERRGADDYCQRLGYFVNIRGPGDARILASLRSRGLLEKPRRDVHHLASRITEDGRLLIEQWVEQDTIPLDTFCL